MAKTSKIVKDRKRRGVVARCAEQRAAAVRALQKLPGVTKSSW